MISEERDHAEEMLTPAQLEYAVQYILRWRNWSPDLAYAARNEAVGALRSWVAVRAIVGAVLRERAPMQGGGKTLCGKCRREWPTAQDAWICYSSGEHRPPINEVR